MPPDTGTRALGELVTPELMGEVRRIELRTRRSISADVLGAYRSAFRGSGLVFSDLREYAEGDDIRHVHWKATARSGRVLVKSYEEDRQLSIMLAVDISRSTDAGVTNGRSPYLRALEFSALLALLAQSSGDALGLALFSDRVEELLRPERRRSQTHRVVATLLKRRTLRPGTDIAGALRHLREHLRRPSIIFVVSDFLAPPCPNELRALACRHDVICALTLPDGSELLPRAGLVQFLDAESGRLMTVDTGNRRAREEFRRAEAHRIEELRKSCRASQAELIELGPRVLESLARLMARRTARLR